MKKMKEFKAKKLIASLYVEKVLAPDPTKGNGSSPTKDIISPIIFSRGFKYSGYYPYIVFLEL